MLEEAPVSGVPAAYDAPDTLAMAVATATLTLRSDMMYLYSKQESLLGASNVPF